MNKNEREINIKLLLAYIFKQWRKILALMLVLGLVVTGYKYLKSYCNFSALQEQYTEDLESYNISKSNVEEQTEKNNQIIANLTEYTKKSIKANIDPTKESRTVASVSIVTSTGNDSADELLNASTRAKAITQAYAADLDGIDYATTASALDTDTQMVKELVSIKSDSNSSIITITVIGSTKDQTEPIMKTVLAKVADEETGMLKQFGEHSIVISDMSTNTVVDNSLLTVVGDKTLSVNTIMNDSLTKISALKTVQKNLENTTIAKPASVTSTVIKGLIKYFLFGLIAGFIATVLFLVIMIVCSGKIQSEEDLKKIWGYKVLSVFPMKQTITKSNKLDAYFDKKIDTAYGLKEKDAIKRAMLNLACNVNQGNKIMVVNVNVDCDMKALTDELSIYNKSVIFVPSNHLTTDEEEYRKLNNADGIILVAQRFTTKIDELEKVNEIANNLSKPIIGSLVL